MRRLSRRRRGRSGRAAATAAPPPARRSAASPYSRPRHRSSICGRFMISNTACSAVMWPSTTCGDGGRARGAGAACNSGKAAARAGPASTSATPRYIATPRSRQREGHPHWGHAGVRPRAAALRRTCATAVSTGSCTRYLRARLTTTAAQQVGKVHRGGGVGRRRACWRGGQLAAARLAWRWGAHGRGAQRAAPPPAHAAQPAHGAPAVATPSATWEDEAWMSLSRSPRPRRTPTCRGGARQGGGVWSAQLG